jgi:hypothetical protein
MRIIGCDLHARQQTVAMLDTATGEVVHVALKHEGNIVHVRTVSLATAVNRLRERPCGRFYQLLPALGILWNWTLRGVLHKSHRVQPRRPILLLGSNDTNESAKVVFSLGM